jgi:hypothetical protein
VNVAAESTTKALEQQLHGYLRARDEHTDSGDNSNTEEEPVNKHTKYRQYGSGHVFNTLRREIQAARLKVILDEELGRETFVKVRHLVPMDLPQIIRTQPSDKGRSVSEKP